MKKKIYFLLAGLTLTISLILSAFTKNKKDNRPNILLIVSEDHGPHLSCYGDEVIKTPALDQIAESGFRFNNAYVTQAVCSPSRSSILSGLYPHQTGHFGLPNFGFRYVVPVTTIYTRMKAAGYRTGMIGKLHVVPDTAFPIDYRRIPGANYDRKNMNNYAEFAAEFMNESDQPFFLAVNYPDAHWPFMNEAEGKPKKLITESEIKPFAYLKFDNSTIRSYTTAMYNCLLRLDECVGDLMAKLKSSGKERNTLVIYLSDHGDEMARGKFDIYEASNKVPFLVSWPGKIKSGMVSNELISTIDIVPTMMEVARIPTDKNLPGKSLMSLFQNPTANFRPYLFTEKNVDQVDLYYPRRAVRDKRYKLIYSLLPERKNMVAESYMSEKRSAAIAGSPTVKDLETASPLAKKIYNAWLSPNKYQLYDLEKDPWEFNDLAADPKYASIKQRLINEIAKWQVATNDPFRFPEKVKRLTQENDTIKVGKGMIWHYPEYMYGSK